MNDIFTILPSQENDQLDQAARHLAKSLLNLSLIGFDDRERCRCALRAELKPIITRIEKLAYDCGKAWIEFKNT